MTDACWFLIPGGRCFSFGSMSGVSLTSPLKRLLPLFALVLSFAGCSASRPPKPTRPAPAPIVFYTPPAALANGNHREVQRSVLLGIDVLEAEQFAPLRGKRVALLTHPAGVDRRGISTVEVLAHAPGVKLVALFGPEHGIYGDAPAAANVANTIDRRTGLPVYSLYGKFRKPTRAMLKGVDAMVIDLQDIGTRSYTFINTMKWAMQGCFENGVEVVVLDRPNPLGGLKVSGPLLDAQLCDTNTHPNSVGAYCVPYVHGLTIGELALMAKDLRPPTGLDLPDRVRQRGKLVVIPMRGWTRSMRWPETGLKWIPTSPLMPDFAAVEGYPMVGLGAYNDPPRIEIGFFHGVGRYYPFRGLSHKTVKPEILIKELSAYHLPGLQFRVVSAPDEQGKPKTGVYMEITDYDAWDPTELNFVLMKMACRLDGRNPFLPGPGRDFTTFLHHMGSTEFFRALQHDGAAIDLRPWLEKWREQDRVYQVQSKRYWLYQ